MQWETISTARPVPEGKNHPTEIREAYRKLLKQQEEDRKVAEEQARYEKRYKQLKKEAKKQREAEEAALPPPPPDHTEEFLVIAAYYAGRGNLTVEEACAILGFTEVVRLESAKWVYKMYVQKYHTDREGGNPEIAQLLNVVKQTLDF
jgi:hypothetical protein